MSFIMLTVAHVYKMINEIETLSNSNLLSGVTASFFLVLNFLFSTFSVVVKALATSQCTKQTNKMHKKW